MDWQATWVWDDGPARPLNAYLYLRKSFVLPRRPSGPATIRVSADTRYRLYVNGRTSASYNGPARGDHLHHCIDTHEVEGLVEGENVLSALVYFVGVGTCHSMLGRAGFLLEARIPAGDETIVVGTDETWRLHPAPYLGGFERMSIQLPFPEVFDAAKEPVGWRLPGFDDSAWGCATVVARPGEEPWPRLEDRDIPALRRRESPRPRLASVLALKRVSKPCATPAEEMEAATSLETWPGDGPVRLRGRALHVEPCPEPGVSIVIDYGREVSGYFGLAFRGTGAARVDVGYSERLEADGVVNPNHFGGCDVHYADRVLWAAGGADAWQTLNPRAFRYVRLDVHDCTEPLTILPQFVAAGYPVRTVGTFQCSDPLLERIWEVGRYTAELCMDDAYMDCPWRERGQWLADARIEALVSAYAFGDTLLTRRAWRQYAQSQRVLDAWGGEGPAPEHHAAAWVKCVYPAAPPFDSVLPTFNCIWLTGLWEYFLLTGDRSLLDEVWQAVQSLVLLLKDHESPNGLLHNLPGWLIVDWANVDLRGEATAVNAYYHAGLQAAARIARALGRPELGSQWEMRAADVRDALNDLLWDRERGVYIDALVDGARSEVVSEQANILCVLYGVADREQRQRILDRFVRRDPAPEPQWVRIQTPYFAFYLLRALYGLGMHQEALDYTRKHWGDMLARGATTFWEQYEPQWSLCHAWSSAPTYDLPAEVAGIRPLQPGYEEFSVDVRPADLTWFRAVVPSPRGEIRVSYHYRTDRPFVDAMGAPMPVACASPAVTVSLQVPASTQAHVSVPLADVQNPRVTINGEEVVRDGAPVHAQVQLADGRLAFRAVPGEYLVEVHRS